MAVAYVVDGVLCPEAVDGTVGVFHPDIILLVGVLCSVVEDPAELVPCQVPVISENY